MRGSSPLLEETSRIWKLWLQSDQRRFYVPCPQCEEMQYLDWGGPDVPHGLKWELHEDKSLASVWYVGTCGCIIDESSKVWMNSRGEWRATNPSGQAGHAGFHIWAGMTLNPNATWPVLVHEWLEAQADPATLVQPFVNTVLGRPYKATYGQEIRLGRFLERLEDYEAEVPAGVQFLTLGGDIQSGDVNPRVEASIYGWGPGLESWLIGHFVLPGDPGQGAVWAALDALLKRTFRKPDGTPLRVQAAAIDSGGHHTSETYQFCNERRTQRVWAIKGRAELGGRRDKVWPRKPSAKLGNVWYMIGGNAARDWAYGSLAVTKVGPRFVHFPHTPADGARDPDEEFFAQMTRERLVVRRQGFTEWEKPKAPREVGVCFVYAYAAVTGLQAMHPRYVAMGKALVQEPDVEPVGRVGTDQTGVSAVQGSVPSTAQSPNSAPTSPPVLARPIDPFRVHTRTPQRGGFLSRQRGWLSRN